MVMNKESFLVRVESMPSEWEANLIVHRLESEGLRATAVVGFTAGFLAESPGSVGILVDSRDESAARSIIGEYFDERKQRALDEAAELSVSREGVAEVVTGCPSASEAPASFVGIVRFPGRFDWPWGPACREIGSR